jgi:hypothetical protein
MQSDGLALPQRLVAPCGANCSQGWPATRSPWKFVHECNLLWSGCWGGFGRGEPASIAKESAVASDTTMKIGHRAKTAPGDGQAGHGKHPGDEAQGAHRRLAPAALLTPKSLFRGRKKAVKEWCRMPLPAPVWSDAGATRRQPKKSALPACRRRGQAGRAKPIAAHRLVEAPKAGPKNRDGSGPLYHPTNPALVRPGRAHREPTRDAPQGVLLLPDL